MIRFALDENVSPIYADALKQKYPTVDIVRIDELPLKGQPDPVVLEWTSQENRVLISHDRRTLRDFAYERVEKGLPMPGVILLRLYAANEVINTGLAYFAGAAVESDMINLVWYIPF